jgi:hypothetical protein
MCPMGIHLTSMHLIAVYFMGVPLIGVHLISVYYVDMHHKRAKRAIGYGGDVSKPGDH